MAKYLHEVRDPIHVFIRLDSEERKVLNSRPFQRLRHIQQLALTSLVYPGATHRRFEHSLGVMELASRVYDVVMNPAHIDQESVRSVVPNSATVEYLYWRRVLRMAALCHDIGHLPFSHAAEQDLLPPGWDHERLTVELIRSSDLAPIWNAIKVQPEDVAKLAVGPKKYRDGHFTDLEAILAEIIVGDAFGVDRMDYLLRDSYHAGVAYGRFDHYRLIDTLRILPRSIGLSPTPEEGRRPGEPTLGIAEGGLQSAEALLLARYFMYTQLYFHPVRRVYDLHLRDFLRQWLPCGTFPTELEQHLQITDHEVMAAILAAARDPRAPGHDPARRIVRREHYRVLYARNPNDIAINPEAARAVFDAACARYDGTSVHYDFYREKKREIDFPVLTRDRRIVSSLALSETLNQVPVVAVDFVFIAPHLRDEALAWLERERTALIAPKREEDA
jgi:uncharacterized protein